jgi:Kef-type K+ transport system membrane component KefB
MFSQWFPDTFPIRDPVLIFAIVLVLFLVSPIVMGRFKLPGMIGLLLAGAILGPHAMGILARDASFILLGAVGLIYIMFTAALEVDLSVFRKYGVQGVVFGIFTFILPQGLGTLMAYYLLGFDWLPAILIASMFASHTLLAYPIVSRLGLSTNPAVTTTLGGTMITDTAALLVLAVVAGMASGEVTEAFWWRLGVSMTVFVGGILIGLPRLGRWFLRRVADDGPAEFVFVLTSVFLCAALSHSAGLEPIVGAFLAGLALNRLIPHSSPLMNRLVFTGEAIFIPFFLLSVGMLLDARVLFGGFRTWTIAIGMTATVVATKWLAAQVTRVLFRYRSDEAQVMFGLSVVQAAATLAVVIVGHRLEMFDDAVVNGTIVMILVTCILGPAVVTRYAPVMAKAAAAAAPEAKAQKGVLIPLLSADQAESAVELALTLRGSDKEAVLYPTFVAADDKELDKTMADGEKLLASAASQVSAAGMVAQTMKRVHDNPGRALARMRKELGVEHIVLPWDGQPSRSGLGLGKVVGALAEDGGANVFLARLPHPLGTCSRTVVLFPPGAAESVGFQGSVAQVRRLAKALGSPIFVLGHTEEEPVIRAAFGGADDSGVKVQTYPNTRLLLPLMANVIQGSDLLILHGVREGDPAYLTEARDFALGIVSRHPDTNLVVLFPVQPRGADASNPPRQGPAVAGPVSTLENV